MKKKIYIALGVLIVLLVGFFFKSNEWWILSFEKSTDQLIILEISNKSLNVLAKIKSDVVARLDFESCIINVKSDRQVLPSGKIVFFDGTVKPGRLTLEINSHLVDIMTSQLTVNGVRYSWSEIRDVIVLKSNQKK